MQNLLNDLKELLTADERLVVDGKLMKNKIIELGLALDKGLLALLLKHPAIKKHFFQDVDGVLVFDKIKFMKFVSNKEFLPDSYTAFKNNIGLTIDDEFISEKKEVVLSWPYKDCVLEGGQKLEGESRNEMFWNEILAPNEIDRLLSPKAFGGFKRFSKNENPYVSNVGIKDNLIIKGNNLIALHSLKKIYGGKIKVIYIDPPYNTGSDGFNYNDSFNHSSWLTFMKNRLEVAHELLRDDGIIFISCDDRESCYLKVLCDEIFKRENFITQLIWRKKAGGGNDSEDIAVEHEYIITYRKKLNGIYKLPLNEETLKNYKYEDEKVKTHGKYALKDLNDPSLSDSPGLHYDIECPDGSILKGDENQWKCNLTTFKERLSDNRIVFKKNKDGVWKVFYKIYLNEEKGVLRKDSNGNIIQKGRNLSSILYDVALNKEGNSDLKKMFGGDYPFSYPKPINLIKTLVRVASKDNDIIMDFFAGSGTTGQAVLELNKEEGSNRRFILVEQLDYVENVTVKRIHNYIKLNKTNDSFLYLELLESFSDLLKKIKTVPDEKLKALFNEVISLPVVKYQLKHDYRINETEGLTPNELRKIIFELIDKNQIYTCFSDIDDTDFGISEELKKLNLEFYKLKVS